jgi:hypothetical protein
MQAASASRALARAKLKDDDLETATHWISNGAGFLAPFCRTTGNSSWALVVTSVSVPTSTQPSSDLASCDSWSKPGVCFGVDLVHQDKDGKRLRAPFRGSHVPFVGTLASYAPFEAAAYPKGGQKGKDGSEGRGLSDLLMSMNLHSHESSDGNELWRFTVKDNAIVRDAVPADVNVGYLRDVDGDGLPDLIGHGQYRADNGVLCGSGYGFSLEGPLLLWHAQPDGSFSATDSVAAAFAKKHCGPKPNLKNLFSTAIKKDEFAVGEDELAARAVCARMWGFSEAEVLAQVQRSPLLNGTCVLGEGHDAVVGEPIPLEHRAATLLAPWLKLRQPFRFSAP